MCKGKVTRFDSKRNKYTVKFDDGDVEMWNDQKVKKCAPPQDSPKLPQTWSQEFDGSGDHHAQASWWEVSPFGGGRRYQVKLPASDPVSASISAPVQKVEPRPISGKKQRPSVKRSNPIAPVAPIESPATSDCFHVRKTTLFTLHSTNVFLR